jgi:uncharacterized protein YjbJ (UPF0337 family)
MNWNVIEQDWRVFKAEVRANWSMLTSEQLTSISGNRIQLAREIGQTYGLSSDAAESQIQGFEHRNQHPRAVSSR